MTDSKQLRLRCSVIGVALLLMPLGSFVLNRAAQLLLTLDKQQGWGLPVLFWQAFTVAANALYITLPLLALLKLSGEPWGRLLPLTLPRMDYMFPAVGTAFGVSAAANLTASIFLGLLASWGLGAQAPVPVFQSGDTAAFFTLLLAAVCPALLEEFLFRGAILQYLRPFGNGLAVGVSGVLFALCHSSAAQFFPALATGLCLGCFAVRSGSLMPGMVFHFTYNASVLSMYMAQTQRGGSLPSSSALTFLGASAMVGVISAGFLRSRFGPVFALPVIPCPLSRRERARAVLTSLPLVCAGILFFIFTAASVTPMGAGV